MERKLRALKRRLIIKSEHYRNKPEDPYNINTALYVAFLELAASIQEVLDEK